MAVADEIAEEGQEVPDEVSSHANVDVAEDGPTSSPDECVEAAARADAGVSSISPLQYLAEMRLAAAAASRELDALSGALLA